ncbi:cbb3-type cytochrome oxidase assembly protein CcoS [Thiohalobacter thiocyanaticus]|uniref:Cbb3-type cytochrome oxidase assembly protein CcoS n=1 Tax=Thiohalobacter thiocyanaticus TaxID=585455 RepID=A0A426QKB9_9GAMM|nr:cbb3-type cytochrome oxidase assembly protein CcoS [Thiohalobacter thiocyanaticus]RRQ22147.1 cbb3-type cytochrome oxidase assembly protein CcoS [Thiohalobacter thiocyanaticus]
MDILYLLIPLALVLLVIAIGAFIWASRSGQFDDLEGPAHRILMDDDDPRIPGHKPPDAGTEDEAAASDLKQKRD